VRRANAALESRRGGVPMAAQSLEHVTAEAADTGVGRIRA